MSPTPLVSVICTCFNHEKYVFGTLNSVFNQTHPRVELFIIDNGSNDKSVEVIQNWIWLHDYPKNVRVRYHSESQNYCKVFNEALKECSGKFVIDLAADDLLYSHHIATAVAYLEEQQGNIYFSNAKLVDERGRAQFFYPLNRHGIPKKPVSQGDIYQELVQRHSVCAATLVIRANVLRKENGYDEALSYEDFDIMVRLSRKHPFIFGNNVGVEKRILRNSFSAGQYRPKNSIMLPSTLIVLKKIKKMNRTYQEDVALKNRSFHELKHALASANFFIAGRLLSLLDGMGRKPMKFWFYWAWWRLKLDISSLYQRYTKR